MNVSMAFGILVLRQCFEPRFPQSPLRVLAVVDPNGGMRLPEVVIDGMVRTVNKRQALTLAVYLPDKDPRSYQVGTQVMLDSCT